MNPAPRKFTGVPRFRSTVRSRRPAVFVGGQLYRPKDGIDWLLAGVPLIPAPPNPLNAGSQRMDARTEHVHPTLGVQPASL